MTLSWTLDAVATVLAMPANHICTAGDDENAASHDDEDGHGDDDTVVDGYDR